MQDTQKMVEKVYNRKNISDVIRATISDEHHIINLMVQEIETYRSLKYNYKSKVDRVDALKMESLDIAIEIAVLVLPIEVVSPIQSVCSLLGSQLEYENLLDGIKTAAELLAVCEKAGLYDIYHHTSDANETGTLGIKPKYELESHIKEYISQTKYLPPMVCRPLPWKKNNKGGGYLSGSGSMILGRMNHNEYHQAVEVINHLQNIPWSLDLRMLEFEETSKKNLDTPEKQVNFARMRDNSEQVYRELLDQGNKFYFVWKRDSRGRSYSQGYHVNLQANSYKKSLLNFHKQELLTDEVLI